ncbi:MAG TPA: DUF4191 domain-containing protein [Kineosporiaceae bacterium]|nr:DUF4191 domain-containing protein [Kineosporiaceae bacterium]
MAAIRSGSPRSDKQAAGGKKPGRLATLRQIFSITRESDPLLPLWMGLGLAGTVLVAYLIGLALGHGLYLAVLGLPMGVLVALVIMSRRAERFAYARAAGQPGVTGQVLKNLRRGWYAEEEPVAIDPRSRDMVFRAVGRPGVALVTEGPVNRVQRLVEGERKRVNRVLGPNVPVIVVHVGDGEGQVPLRRVNRRLMSGKPALTKSQVSQVAARLRALGGARPPIPKGIDPTRVRPDRKGVRGR